MRHFHVQTADGKPDGSWSAGQNGQGKVIAQLTSGGDAPASQSRVILDVISATLLVQGLIAVCQSVIKPSVYPRSPPGQRGWLIERHKNDVRVTLEDEILPPESTTVDMSIMDATDFAAKLMIHIIEAQRVNNMIFENK